MSTSPATDPWNTLEIAKLVVGILTPLSVAGLGLFISRHLKRLDLVQWKNQKLLEKRIAVYDIIAPQLNLLYCFFMWEGYWKFISPEGVFHTRRELDKTMNVYRYLFEDEVYAAYQAFSHTLFETHAGADHDVKIRSVIRGPDGDRSAGKPEEYEWKAVWDQSFAAPDRTAPKQEVREKYHHLMAVLSRSFGAERGDA